MKLFLLSCISYLALNVHAADTNALTLTRTIPLPNVTGRLDHFAIDLKGQRLFMAGLSNNTVEIFDLAAGNRIQTIPGCSKPQGLAFLPAQNHLVIANGISGEVQILDGSTFKAIKIFGGMPKADNVRYDAKSDLIYVGHGDGAVGIINATNGHWLGGFKLAGHPESFQLEKTGNRIFVNVPDAGHIAVVDRLINTVVAIWPLEEFHANYPMALDEANHRLLVGCRQPARLVVLDTTTGKRVTDIEISGDTDDLFYDASRKEIFVSCGAGFIDVIDQVNADTYRLRTRIPTVSGARTSFFSPDRGEFYLGVRDYPTPGQAELRIYKLN